MENEDKLNQLTETGRHAYLSVNRELKAGAGSIEEACRRAKVNSGVFYVARRLMEGAKRAPRPAGRRKLPKTLSSLVSEALEAKPTAMDLLSVQAEKEKTCRVMVFDCPEQLVFNFLRG